MTEPWTLAQVVNEVWSLAMGTGGVTSQFARKVQAALESAEAERDRLARQVEAVRACCRRPTWPGRYVNLDDLLAALATEGPEQ